MSDFPPDRPIRSKQYAFPEIVEPAFHYKNPVTGRYQFYRGSRNAIRPALEESDIEALKQRIEKLEL